MTTKTVPPRLLMVCAALAGMLSAPGAQALRPYDGTDAGVAEPGVFELEIAPAGYVRSGTSRTLVGPFVVANLGFEGDTELVLEGKVNRQQGGIPDGYRTSFGDTALSVKHLFRRGSLQDGGGLSVAGECGVLLPELHGSDGTGASCAGVASQRFKAATVHFNAALVRTREHTRNRFAGVIVEGETEGAVRPIMELYAEHDNHGSHTRSALLGLIWKHSEDLAFDVGMRKARSDGESLTELRAGLTWSYALRK